MTKQTPISAAAQALYRSVFGAPPHLVVELDNDMVLLETSEATRSVEHCPSGYREVLMRRGAHGEWNVYPVAEPGRYAAALQAAADARAQISRSLPA